MPLVGGIPPAEHGTGSWDMLTLIASSTGAIALLALRRLRPRRDSRWLF